RKTRQPELLLLLRRVWPESAQSVEKRDPRAPVSRVFRPCIQGTSGCKTLIGPGKVRFESQNPNASVGQRPKETFGFRSHALIWEFGAIAPVLTPEPVRKVPVSGRCEAPSAIEFD